MGVIVYTFDLTLVRTDGTLNRDRYMSVMLRPVDLFIIRDLWNVKFQQANAELHVSGILQTFFDTESFRLLHW